jgi:hypothetical protein
VLPYIADPQLLSLAVGRDPVAVRLLGLSAFGRWGYYANAAGASEEAELERVLREERSGAPPVLSPRTLVRLGPKYPELQQQAKGRFSAMGRGLYVDELVGVPVQGLIISSGLIQRVAMDGVQRARRARPAARNNAYLSEAAVRLISHSTYNADELLPDELKTTPNIRDHLISLAARTSLPLVTLDTELAPRDGIFRIDDSSSGLPAYIVHLDFFLPWIVNQWPFDLLKDVPVDLLELSVTALENRQAA